MTAYNLHNPTRAPRVIWDGITNAKPIRVLPGETQEDVVLADHVVARLRRDAALGEDVELKVTEVKPVPPAAAKTKKRRTA